MKELIDKADVVAELEKLYNLDYDNTSNLSCGKKIMLRHILLFLDTLETKEVDLKKEFDYDDYMSFFNKHPNYSEDWGFDECWEFAKYFFELGIRAQKGE